MNLSSDLNEVTHKNTMSKGCNRPCPILTFKNNIWMAPKLLQSSENSHPPWWCFEKEHLPQLHWRLWLITGCFSKGILTWEIELDSGIWKWKKESTAESTKIRVIPKWLNRDTANEKVKLWSVRIFLSLFWRSWCTQIPAAGRTNWDQAGSVSWFQSLPLMDFSLTTKEKIILVTYTAASPFCHLQGRVSTELTDLALLPGTRGLLLGNTTRKQAGIWNQKL